jgi:hypothetical protein
MKQLSDEQLSALQTGYLVLDEDTTIAALIAGCETLGISPSEVSITVSDPVLLTVGGENPHG